MAIIDLSSEEFKNVVANKEGLLLIDFWAKWCAPCRSFAVVYESAAQKFTDVNFYKVDVESEAELAREFNIRSIPHIVVIKDKEVVYSQPGALNEDGLTDLITKFKNINSEVKS